MDQKFAMRFVARGPESQQREIVAAVNELLQSYEAL
jgi:hypothetical protein